MQLFLRVLCMLSCLWCLALHAEEQTQPSPEKLNAWGAAVNEQDAAQAADQGEPFNIYEYVVNGNSVLTVTQIEKAVYPFLGENRSIDDVEKARSALEKAFHDQGYLTVFVNIPEQEVNAGVVKLDVLEGKIEKLTVDGSRYYSLGKIRQSVTEFAEGHVPHFPTVQKQIASVNINGDRVVAPVLRPGKTPGMVEVDLKVDDKFPLHASMELNDRYTPNTTETRLSGNLRYDNLWQSDHSLGLGFQVTPEDTNEVKVFSTTYVIPHDGDYWALYGVVSKSDISAVGDLNVLGNGNIYGLRYIHPMPSPVKSFNHNLTLGVDYKDFEENTRRLGSDLANTPITYLPFLIGYTGNLNTPESNTKLDLNFIFSTKALVNDEDEFAQKRFLGRPNFSYLRGQLEHTQTLPSQWQLYGSLGGQTTGDSLISNEQYFLGGLDTVRGFLESSALGDTGTNVTMELRTPPLQKYLASWMNEVRLLAFYDYGFAKVRDPITYVNNDDLSQVQRYILSSYGVGLDIKAAHGLFMRLDFAQVLQSRWTLESGRTHPIKPIGMAEEGDTRLHFRVGFDW
ncbi:ShlB/FhaC/HecB family hemolysin secretion/activation protein [Methylophilus luteus]|uniref:ShlB/FhaC/HecB family hemolysin secretion/activation protein n=1 Tax=Methylophilus luteus TaxID=640108 RepID=A0ABW3F238_9PROT